MKVSAIELRRVRLPLLEPFRASYGVESTRDVLLVRVIGPESDGIGECVAMSEPLYVSEFVDQAELVVRRFLIPRLDPEDVAAARLGALFEPIQGHRMAKAALEMAVLDAELKLVGQSLASRLGATRARVPAGVVVGIHASTGELLETVGRYLDLGYRRVKLKIRPGWDVGPVQAVRERFGDALSLQVDANGAYQLSDLRQLQSLDPFGLTYVEQPLPADDVRGHVELAHRLATPICLDESIVSMRSALDAIERGACQAVSIKPGRVGGLFEAVRIHDLCVSRGIAATCGGMLETGIGRSANLALAALPGFNLTGDLSASDRYFARDITLPIKLEDGSLRVPNQAGHGAVVDPGFIHEITTRRETIPLVR